jgi:hypothetical protein
MNFNTESQRIHHSRSRPQSTLLSKCADLSLKNELIGSFNNEFNRYVGLNKLKKNKEV